QLVRGDFESIGRPDALLAGMPDLPLKKGQRVDSVAEVVKDLLNDQDSDAISFDGVNATLRDIKDEGGAKVGVFDVSFTMSAPAPNGVRMTYTMPGPMEVRASDCRLVHAALSGDVTMNAQVKATGTITFTVDVAYSQ